MRNPFINVLTSFGILFLFIPLIKAQEAIVKHSSKKEVRIDRYLSDTLNAPSKIRELLDSSRKARDVNDKVTAIEDFQIALALVPAASDSSRILATLYSNFSELLHSSGAEDMATKYAKMALMENRKASKAASIWNYNLLGKIVSSYIQRKEYDSAEIYYLAAKNEALATGDHLAVAAAENNIGILYDEMGMHDSAFSCFIHSIRILAPRDAHDSFLLASINDNIGLNYYGRNKYDSGVKYFLKNIDYYSTVKNNEGKFKSYLGTANCMLALHNYQGALSNIDKARECMEQNPSDINAGRYLDFLKCKLNYYSAVGNLKMVSTQQNAIIHFKDSLILDQNKISEKLLQGLTEAEVMKANRGIQIYNLQLQRNKTSLNESEKNTRMSLLLALIVSLSGGIIITLLALYFRNRNRMQLNEIKLREQKEQLTQSELKTQRLEQEKVERELSFKKDDLRNLGTYLTELKDMQDTVAEKLHEIKNQKLEQQKGSITSLLQELNTKIHSRERLQIISESIEQVNAEFHKKLIYKYPELTKSELELCGYLKLNISNKEICVLKGISQEAVKKGRYRLRKKLGLSPDEDIYKTLTEI